MKPLFSFAALVWSTALLLCHPAIAASASNRLTVCMDEDNAPFSLEGSRSGIDVDIARAIAGKLQRDVDFVWIGIPMRGGLGKALKASIQAARCELFMGIPVDEETAADLAKRGLSGSQPYLTLGYLLVSAPRSAPMTLTAARQAKRIGAVTATPADLYLHKEKYNRVPYGNNTELMHAIESGEIEVALVWSPAFGALRSADKNLQPVVSREQILDPMLRTNMIIVISGARAGLARDVNAALDQLRTDGAIRAAAEAQGLPWLAP
jgi:ABC-type amino acid transport substrate-binding protein